ncbi:MAG: hypothetical protein LBR07_08880 [Puniceicoccales bacterium]|jgi:hypothetical protein|nr:hypothetical protein [Puniceicoccales bacterium]
MKRLLSLLALAVITAGFSACGQRYDTANYGNEVQIETGHNLGFGLLKISPHNYVTLDPTTIETRSTEYTARREFSGNKVELFWGAISFTDY